MLAKKFFYTIVFLNFFKNSYVKRAPFRSMTYDLIVIIRQAIYVIQNNRIVFVNIFSTIRVEMGDFDRILNLFWKYPSSPMQMHRA